MPLYKINKHTMNDDLVDNEQTLSRKVITKMLQYINIYNNETNTFSVENKLFINVDFVDDLFSQVQFTMPPMGRFADGGIVGKLAGSDVYVSELLDEYEIFIGTNKELNISKRNEKLNKILNNKLKLEL